MAITIAVQEFLRRANVDYTVFRHAPAYTAQEEAALAHVPGRNWAKVVVCIADGEPIQAVVPADLHVDLERLAEVVVASEVRLAREDELVWLFADCEPGRCRRSVRSSASVSTSTGSSPKRRRSFSMPAPMWMPWSCATKILPG